MENLKEIIKKTFRELFIGCNKMNKLLSIIVVSLLLSTSTFANILDIKCQFDTVREIGFGKKSKKNWFASFKDKMGYKFDIKNLKLIETSHGKFTQKLSLPISIKDDPKKRDYNAKQISGTFSSIPKSNQKGALTIFVYQIFIGVDDEFFYKNGHLSDIKTLIHILQQYRVTGSAMNEWLNFSPAQSYDDFQRWIDEYDDNFNLRLSSGHAVGRCEVVE